ncbi:MAG: hypothetical protein H6741_03990 [Alphaproteobacteria bacterium]|nr:hypothetical protein [Alphaproteobacteria bacterium]MCB9791867.1 hypothetical protein [Alphaproteobacteria bacterium]
MTLALLGAPGCVPHSPQDVEALAERAAEDPKAAKRLVKALGSDELAVAERAFVELVALGTTAVPYLRMAIFEREPYAGQAIRVIGASGNPEYFELIEELLGDPDLQKDAAAAFDLAEQALWERIDASPSQRMCDHYQRWFPRGAHIEQVRHARDLAEARDALMTVGTNASEAQLVGFIERFPGTPAAQQVREDLAMRHLDAAVRERDAGRIDSALRSVDEARYWDKDVDANSVEASIRTTLGRSLAERNDLDGAIVELDRARQLGSEAAARQLGELLLQRGNSRLDRGDLVGGMSDLRRAEEVAPSMAPQLSQARAERTAALLSDVRAGAPNRQIAAGALVVSATEDLDQVRAVILQRLDMGDAAPLRGASEASLRVELPAETQAWLGSLLEESLRRSEGGAKALLGDRGRMGSLVRPREPWGDAVRADRARAAAELDTYVTAAALAWRHVESGGTINQGLPSSPPRPEQELSLLLFQGMNPEEPSDSLLLRAQLMHHALAATARLDNLARLDPARVAVQFIGRANLPADLFDWAVLADDALGRSSQTSYSVPLPDGSVGELRHRRAGDTLVLELRTPPGSRPSSSAVVSDGLTSLLGSARLLHAADPTVGTVELRIGTAASGNWQLASVVSMSISREELGGIDWVAVERAAPFGPDDVRFVPRVRGL